MIERHETSGVHCNERVDRARSSRARPSMRTVRGASVPVAVGRTSMAVHDVAGPIVTGVLGGD